MARRPREIVHEENRSTPAWTGVVLLASLVGVFALLAVFLANNHAWTDALVRRLPVPGLATSLASDPVLASQMRVVDPKAKVLTLADRSTAVVVEATVINDSLIPVRGVRLAAEAMREGRSVAQAAAACGKNVSERLLKRLPRDEVRTLMDLAPSSELILASGEHTRCQVAISSIRGEVDEVSYRVASVEPTDDHLPANYRPVE
ncbi:MAG TPA: hypothetical protein VEL28_22165 [Candidatus Binatia bacterium]|nr:hypothetical protein [Candidatus Binatia bacterium]